MVLHLGRVEGGESGSSQGQILALTVLFVPNSLDSGYGYGCYRGMEAVRDHISSGGGASWCFILGEWRIALFAGDVPIASGEKSREGSGPLLCAAC